VTSKRKALLRISLVCFTLGIVGAHIITHHLSYAHEWRIRRLLHIPLKAPSEIILGNPQAPVRIFYYYSLTCRYCRLFLQKILPELQKKYLDTGRLCLVFCEFPDDKISLDGFTLLRSLPISAYFPVLKVLFAQQEDWIFMPAHLFTLFETFGISAQMRHSLLSKTSFSKALLFRRFEAEEHFNLSAVPSFVVKGQVYEGALSLLKLEEIINGR
jgi:protein-disulfide isomerase